MKERQDSLQQAKSREFDLLVIGGGIAGAGIAQNAAARGLSVLLLEKADFASGSSSRSSQLIHGDLPYIEQLRFKLTRRLSEERERLKRLAPHLIKDISCVLPLIANNTFFNLKATVGLGLYDVLTMSARYGNAHAFLNRKKLANLVPAIADNLVSGAIQFQDAITDDARLVLAVIKSASYHGAIALNYVQASGFRLESGKISGLNCHDRFSGEEFLVSGKLCVNASGVWTDEVCRSLSASAKPQITPTKSTQIIVSASAFETNSGVFLPAKAGRFVYVLPWQHALLIGSTEAPYQGDLDHPRSGQDEIDYLLSVVNSYTGEQKLNPSDVKATISGLAAHLCLDIEGVNPAALQEHVILESSEGMLSLVGAKLGNYRIIAEELMERLKSKHPGLCKNQANTDSEMLGGWTNKEEFPAKSTAIEIKARRLSIDPASIQHLISNYGAEAEHVVDLVGKQPSLNQRIIADFPVIMAEIPFSVINEMTVSVQDFLFRRSRLGVLNHKQALEAAPRVAEMMGQILGWDNYRSKVEVSCLESEMFERQEEVDAVGI